MIQLKNKQEQVRKTPYGNLLFCVILEFYRNTRSWIAHGKSFAHVAHLSPDWLIFSHVRNLYLLNEIKEDSFWDSLFFFVRRSAADFTTFGAFHILDP